ncbi:FKBP-type peptidyl-prolyl cis-trans isomerase [Angustibacter aerolatus]
MLPVALAAGCANADKEPTTGATKAAASGALQTVQVSGDAGKKPTVKLGSTPTKLTASGTRVLKPGTGATIAKGQRVTLDYLLVNGTSGKEADTTWGKSKANFLADPAKFMPGLANGMIGQKVGSRVLVGVTPKDGFADTGNQQLGIAADDTMLFVLDLEAASAPLAKATGTAVTPPAGLPTVAFGADGKPTVTIPKTAAPKKLVVQPLIKGTGKKITKGQTITAAYVGVNYRTGKPFDSSYQTGNLLDQPIGVGALVPGFDAGIVGQTVGSRVLLVLPPASGYGKTGNAQAGIKGTDTIVFVVDVLDAY